MIQIDDLPEGVTFPFKDFTLKELADKYNKSTRTLRDHWKDAGIYKAMGYNPNVRTKRRGFRPHQVIIAFILYDPPNEYTRDFFILQKHGWIDRFIERYNLKPYLQGKDRSA